MIMSIIALILFVTVSVNTDRQNSARRYAQGPRGQMGFKWTRQYAQKPAGYGYAYPKYGKPINKEQPYPQYPYGKKSNGFGNVPPSNTGISSTESTQNTIFESTEEEEYDIDSAIQNTLEYEPETSIVHEPNIMNCVQDKCAESFNACFNDPQCKQWMLQLQENGSLNDECPPSQNVDASPVEPQTTAIDSTISSTDSTHNTYDETSSSTSSTSNTESTYDTYSTYQTYSTYDYDVISSTSNADIDDETEGSKCEYTELFLNAYNCGVKNHCYADQLKLAQSHQYLAQSPSNFRVTANVTGSKSASHNWTILIVALSSALGALVMFEITRRLYKKFQSKIECEYQCQWLALNNSIRYLKNKWEQIRGYKYEKTHHDLDTIEESSDAEIYGIGSSSDKEETMQTKNKETLNNNDSDISDDVELQRTDDDAIDITDDQFVHDNDTIIEQEEEQEEKQPELDNKDRREIIVEAVQEPIQESK